MALVYDFFLLLGITFAYGAVITLGKNLLGHDALSPSSPIIGVLTLLGLWVCCALFYTWCWLRSGQTLGMKSWRIRLINSRPTQLTWKQCWMRCLWASLCNGLFGIGLIWCYLNRNKFALQDALTGTQVVLLPKDKKTN